MSKPLAQTRADEPGAARAMPVTIEDLVLISGLIAVGFLVAVAFYESLSTRDVLVGRATRIARRITRRA